MNQNASLSRVRMFVVIYFEIFKTAFSLFEQCNHVVELNAGKKIYINSPYYPADYPLGTSCRYTIVAPLDYELNFKCSIDLNVDATAARCQNEVFYFNGEGNEVLTESEYFCEPTNIERESFLNRAVISYISQPLYKRNLGSTTTLYTSNNNEDLIGSVKALSTEENLSTPTTTSLLELHDESYNLTNAFTQLIELWAHNNSDDTPLTMEPTTMTTKSAEEENAPDPKILSTNKTSATETVNSPDRRSRVVNQNFNLSDSQYYGYYENRGGGRFSCLVEAVEPPCDCGWSVSLKIAGATGVAGVSEFPSMAGLKTVRSNMIFCGATIIHHRYLISAAHCFMAPETNHSDLIRVVVGEIDTLTVLESLYTRIYEVEAIIRHEYFFASSRNLRNDIALLRTRIPIEWNRNVGPACLPFRSFKVPGSNLLRRQPWSGQSLEAAGWGTTAFGGTQSTQLLKTTLNVFPTDQCQKVLRYVPSGIFCTFTPGHDTCQYDSGGALYARNDRLFAVGIVSYGFACAARRPSVNTRIASFLKWIQTKSSDAIYCVK